jgi:spermidine/putrescine transport system permease protein
MMSSPPRHLRRFGFLPLVLPTWVLLGGLFVLPLISVLLISFATPDNDGAPKSIESAAELWQRVSSGDIFAKYQESLQPPAERRTGLLPTFWRSLWIAVLTTVLCAIISYPIAYYIAVKVSARMKGFLLALAVIPFWTSFLIRTYAWMTILRPYGLINTALMDLGLISKPLDLLYNDMSVLIGLVYGELPFMILPLYASLEKLDRGLLEASSDLGAGSFSTFWRVTFPLSLPGLAAGVILVFIPAAGQFIVSDLLGGKSLLIGNIVQDKFQGYPADQPLGAAVAVELTIGILLMVWMYAWWSRRKGEELV